jgi:iron(III) transport system substrate-binding protein
VLDRLRAEKANPQADLWFGAPSEIFARAASEGLIEPYTPTWADKVPAEARDAQANWFGTYMTPEVIAFNTQAVSAADAPKDWDEVVDPKWKGKVLIRNPVESGTMRAIFGAILARSIAQTGSTAQGWDWLRKLDANTKEYVLNPALLYQKLGRQEGVITLYNMPDIATLEARTKTPVGFVFPKSGTPLLVDAIALVRGSKQPAAAKEFYEYVTTPAALRDAAVKFLRIPGAHRPAGGLAPRAGASRADGASGDAGGREAARRQPRRVDEVLGQQHPQQPARQVSPARDAGGGARRASALVLERVTRRYPGNPEPSVDAVSLSIAPGELVALVGASGSGKTTTLRIAAGYETPDSGRVVLTDESGETREITHEPPQRRGFGMVFQHYALFPHMSVEQNVAFGLEARGVGKAERLAKAREALVRRRARGQGERVPCRRSPVGNSSASRWPGARDRAARAAARRAALEPRPDAAPGDARRAAAPRSGNSG